MDIALMVEGQNGLNWPLWQQMAELAEDLGFAGLYRSDHFTNANPPDIDSLETWVSLTWLAGHTRRIEFGPLVSPVSFRHPAITARTAAAIDDLSGGRLTLGLGAGWQQREHEHFGFDLLNVKGRFARFEEGLEVITRLLHSDTPVNFSGKYYPLQDAILLPRPKRPGGPPILIGGNGAERTLPLVARFADEWNAVFARPEDFMRLNRRLDELLKERGRQPQSVKRSMMTGCYFGKDTAEVEQRCRRHGHSPEDLRQNGILVGTGDEICQQLDELKNAGVQRVMLQWLDLSDAAGIKALAKAVL